MHNAVVRIEPVPGLAAAELQAIGEVLGLLCTCVEWAPERERRPVRSDSSPWWVLLATVLQRQVEAGTLRLPGKDRTTIEGVKYLSDRGGAPVWCLWDNGGRKVKLRVDSDPDVSSRIVGLLREADRLEWPCCARLVEHGTFAVVKTWLVGEPLATTDLGTRPRIVHEIGQELARLHGRGDGDVHLVCSADDFNTIVTPTGHVAFVDLEATRRGSRWIDLMWSEELLCRSPDERVRLWDGYAAVSGFARPSGGELLAARQEFLVWLQEQLRRAHRRKPDNLAIVDDLRRVEEALSGGKPFTRRQ